MTKYITEIENPNDSNDIYQVKDVEAARTDHVHGQITSDGKITSTTALGSGDNIIFRDTSDGNKIKASSLTFGSGTTTYLRNDGTWGSPAGTGIPYGATLMPTNPFGGNQLYINSIDNAFASADKKFWVKVTTHNKVVDGVEYPYIDTTKAITDPDYFVDSPVVSTLTAGSAFEGDYETACTCPVGRYMKVHIQFAPFTDSWTPATGTSFTGYPYGTYYLSYYYVNTPSQNSQVRVYNKYSAHTIGWKLYTCSTFKGTLGQQNFIEQLADSGDYQRSCIEFIIFARDSGNETKLTEIDYKLTRPNLSRDGSTVTKYGAQKLYYDFTWYKHNDNSANTATITLEANTGNITNIGTTQSASVKVTSLTASKLVATDANKNLVSYTLQASDIPDLSSTYKTKQTAVSETLSGASVLATLSQTANGNVSITTRQLTPQDIGINPDEVMKFLGVTTTVLSDGSTTNPITIGNESVTAVAGNVVIYNDAEFIWCAAVGQDPAHWAEFGDLSDLGDLAYKDSGTVTVNSQDVKLKFNGSSKSVSATSTATNTGAASTSTITGTITMSTNTPSSGETGNYTPSGTITNGTISFSGSSSVTGLVKSNKTPTATEILTSVSIPTNGVVVSGTKKYLHTTATSTNTGNNSDSQAVLTAKTTKYLHTVATSTTSGANSGSAVSAYTSNTPTYKSLATTTQTSGTAPTWSNTATQIEGDYYRLEFSWDAGSVPSVAATVATGSLTDAQSGLVSSISFGTTSVAPNAHTHTYDKMSLTSNDTSTDGFEYVKSVTSGNPTLTTTKTWGIGFAEQPTLENVSALSSVGTASQTASTFSGTPVNIVATPVLLHEHTHSIPSITVSGTYTPEGTITNNGTTTTFTTGQNGTYNVEFSPA